MWFIYIASLGFLMFFLIFASISIGVTAWKVSFITALVWFLYQGYTSLINNLRWFSCFLFFRKTFKWKNPGPDIGIPVTTKQLYQLFNSYRYILVFYLSRLWYILFLGNSPVLFIISIFVIKLFLLFFHVL